MTDAPQVFRPSREHVLAIVLMTGIALIGIAWAPLLLSWLLIIPAAYLVWVFGSSTRVDTRGVTITYPLRPNVSIAWDNLSGIAFKGAKALATTSAGKEHPMPGVTFNTIPELSEASGGRITDVITSSAEAADGKYEIIDREGRRVLLSREEYDEYLRDHPDTPGPRPETAQPTDSKE
ncbi:PH domain-containing protein [Corynebacterium qintianiae]|uniref:PH domain-containing protein n=1 Tax=Corynebacterium qintianiae TaxID=2709392 RepID=A0A7T0KNN1_9CORY|nr:PH domain-containing protein [Corynebacterium qintianiae]QPK84053.1 PH domain-containing protein [Corynebacterium qintianiae]